MNVSLVIPARDEQNYIAACLRSVTAQTTPFYEVIVVDNASNDATVAIAKYYGAKVLHEPRKGIVFARNRGFDAADGDVIARIDADTVLPLDWNQRIVNHFQKQAAGAVTGPPIFYDCYAAGISSWLYRSVVFHYNHLLLKNHILWGANMALRSSAWEKVKKQVAVGNDFHEDLDLAICMHAAGQRVDYLKDLKVGASLRRLYTSGVEFKRYIEAWYATYNHHGIRKHLLHYLGGSIITMFQPYASRILRVQDGLTGTVSKTSPDSLT